jgi:hypothetical protein
MISSKRRTQAMSKERLNAIIQMIPGWKERDGYEEDSEKTYVLEEVLAEVQRLQAMSQSGTGA